MFELTFKELVARKRRLLSTVFAVLLGVVARHQPPPVLQHKDLQTGAGIGDFDVTSGRPGDAVVGRRRRQHPVGAIA